MKAKQFLAAIAVTCSLAMVSCTGNKANNAAAPAEAEAVVVEAVEGAAVQSDSCCQAKDSCATACGEKKECCQEKEGGEKKACCKDKETAQEMK